MSTGIGSSMGFVDRLDHDALPAKPEDVVRPSRRWTFYGRTSLVPGLKQLVERPGIAAVKLPLRTAVHDDVEFDNIVRHYQPPC
jgi:hypothetical protein